MAKFLSGRQKNLKIGISSYSENLTSLEVIGKVGIGSTAFNPVADLDIRGSLKVRDTLTVDIFNLVYDNLVIGGNLSVVGIGTINTLRSSTGIVTSLSGTNLNYSGITTLGLTSTTNLTSQQLFVSGLSTFSGITTHTQSLFGTGASFTGIITATSFRGDGSQLTGVIGTQIVTQDLISTPVFLTFANNAGVTSLGIATTGPNALVFIPSSGNLGIGTTNPTAKLNVVDNSSSDALRITQTGSGNAFVVEDSTNPDATPFVVRADGKVGVGTTGLIQYGPNASDTSTFGIIASTGGDSAFVLKGNNGSTTDGSGQTLAIIVGATGGTGSGTNLSHFSHDTSGIGTRRNAIRFTDNQIRFENNVSGSVDVTINSSGDGELLVGTTAATGTASQPLQVTGGAYVSGSVGIGTTNPTSKLTVVGDGYFTGIITANSFVGTALSISGISTLGGSYGVVIKSDGSNGIVTSANPGVSTVTYYGDGSKLTGIGTAASATNVVLTTDTSSTTTNIVFSQTPNQNPTSSLKTNPGLIFDASTSSLGIGTTNPTSKLTVQGDVLVSGVITATSFRGDGSQLTGVTGTQVVSQPFTSTPVFPILASNSGVSSVGIATTGPNALVFIPSSGNLGIGTTNPTSKLQVAGDVLVSGVSTLGTVKISSGIITASSGIVTYFGDGSNLINITASSIVGVTSFATNAGIATNLKGGLVGNVPYQSATDTTVFLTNGSLGTILQSNGVGNAPSWVSAAPAAAITGLTIRDEGTIVGSANSVSQLNFVGAIVSATSSAGIATITFLDYVSNAGIATFATNAGISTNVIGGIASVTQFNVSGVSTLGTVKISSGIITASSGIVTYFGDGSNLINITASSIVGVTSFATNAGIATNLKGGLVGNVPYQSATDTTAFLINGSSGTILQSNGIGNAPSWVSAAPAAAITGLTIRDEGTIVGSANSVSELNFVGAIVSATSSAGIATITFLDYVSNAGIATFATNAGISTFATNAGIATFATNAGIATFATNAGIATALQYSRTFEITGDIVASPISFDGTSNVSLAATIQPNSVGLGTDTFGDYVKDISGTANQITVTGGTGEGSTPTLSFPNQVTIPQDVTVTRDLLVSRNLNVNGNITIGGTSATLFTTELKISDPDIVLGFRTDGNGNDVSNDNTANHGGVALASTEGTPLVQLFIAGIETNPATYKKIMWFKSGTFAGLGTDAWLINYAVGIGSTQFPSGTRLAAGSVQFTENDLAIVRNINASGVVTASNFVGTLTGNVSSATFATNAGIATFATNAGIATFATNAGIATFATNAGIATFATNAGIATFATNAGVSTYATNAGIATFATNAGVSTYATNAGIATFTSEWILGDVGSSDYTFTGPGFTGAESDPVLYLVRGQQYKFTNTMGAHPFRIQSTPNGSAGTQYNDGITNNDVSNGTLTWDVQFDAPGLLYYQCTAHGSMGGKIYIIDAGIGPDVSVNTTGIITAASFSGNASSATFATTAGVSTSVIGGIGSITQLQVTGVSTFTNGPILVGTATSTGTASQRLQVTGGAYVSGNLGIGTTNATASLTVAGNTANILIGKQYTNANAITLNGSTASTDYNILSSAANNLIINRPSGKTITFSQADSSHANFDTSNNFILNSGNLAIGNFTPNYAIDAGAASLNKAGRVGSIIFGTAGTSYGVVGYNAKPSALNAWTYDVTDVASWIQFLSGGHVFYRAASGTAANSITALESGRFDSSGNLGIGTTNPTSKLHVIGDVLVVGVVTATDFNSASDAKLKTNIQPIADPLEKVIQIKGVSFNWIKDNKPSMGVIANELQKVLPELVSDTDPKTVNYNGLIGLLIECVKHQQNEIEQLKKKVN